MDEMKVKTAPAGEPLDDDELDDAAGGVCYNGNQKIRICSCGGEIDKTTGKCKKCGK